MEERRWPWFLLAIVVTFGAGWFVRDAFASSSDSPSTTVEPIRSAACAEARVLFDKQSAEVAAAFNKYSELDAAVGVAGAGIDDLEMRMLAVDRARRERSKQVRVVVEALDLVVLTIDESPRECFTLEERTTLKSLHQRWADALD